MIICLYNILIKYIKTNNENIANKILLDINEEIILTESYKILYKLKGKIFKTYQDIVNYGKYWMDLNSKI